jgi:hypothetical protein
MNRQTVSIRLLGSCFPIESGYLLGDILRARVRTLGIEEHYFIMETGPFFPTLIEDFCSLTTLQQM